MLHRPDIEHMAWPPGSTGIREGGWQQWQETRTYITDLEQRLVAAEKVIAAAKKGHIHKPAFEFGQQVRLHEDRSECPLCAALDEWGEQ